MQQVSKSPLDSMSVRALWERTTRLFFAVAGLFLVVTLAGPWLVGSAKAQTGTADQLSIADGQPALPGDEGAEQSFATALAAMDQGDYATAKAIYDRFVTSGVENGRLYYNLGLCNARLGKNGEAIAAFLAARQLRPRDPNVQANLAYLLQRIPDRLEAVDKSGALARFQTWLGGVTTKEYAWTAAILCGLWGTALGIMVLRLAAERRPWIFMTVSAIAILLVAVCAWLVSQESPWGAVVARKTKVRAGPGEANTLVFELSEGAPVRYDGASSQAWLRVALSDGKKGWILAQDIRIFGLTPDS